AYGFIMRPQRDISPTHGQCSTLKIHSSLYH
ncbi:cell division inhibitor SulA, partial [Serratia sp. CY81166]